MRPQVKKFEESWNLALVLISSTDLGSLTHHSFLVDASVV